jgi:hypothetical protein
MESRYTIIADVRVNISQQLSYIRTHGVTFPVILYVSPVAGLNEKFRVPNTVIKKLLYKVVLVVVSTTERVMSLAGVKLVLIDAIIVSEFTAVNVPLAVTALLAIKIPFL